MGMFGTREGRESAGHVPSVKIGQPLCSRQGRPLGSLTDFSTQFSLVYREGPFACLRLCLMPQEKGGPFIYYHPNLPLIGREDLRLQCSPVATAHPVMLAPEPLLAHISQRMSFHFPSFAVKTLKTTHLHTRVSALCEDAVLLKLCFPVARNDFMRLFAGPEAQRYAGLIKNGIKMNGWVCCSQLQMGSCFLRKCDKLKVSFRVPLFCVGFFCTSLRFP